MKKRTVYVYNKEELASAIYDASNYSVVTEIIYGTSAFSVTIDGNNFTTKNAAKLEKIIKKSANKLWSKL
jgi:hypothetical protein